MGKDAFQKTGEVKSNFDGNRKEYLRDFRFVEDMALPIQILPPLEDLFPDGFPEVDRHWVTKDIDDGQGGLKKKSLPPIICTAKMKNSHGHCLVCYAKSISALDVDKRTSKPSTDLVVPILDHTKYSKSGTKYEPLNPEVKVYGDTKKNVFEGGLKVMYASAGQYRQIRGEHDNVQTACAKCDDGVMHIESLNCEKCKSPLYEGIEIAQMKNEDLRAVKYKETKCAVCGHEAILDMVRKCSVCSGTTSKTIYQTVLLARVEKSKGSDGRESTKYYFDQARAFKPRAVEEKELRAFFEKMHRMVVLNGPSLEEVHELIGIKPPEEWLRDSTSQNSQPYGEA